tara:strand:- start:297 stop:1145 length:849 start_codon:yes stop_codon:yes gene_type:complete
MKTNLITVVIPTLGTQNMNRSLKILNSNKYIKKIIISLPKNFEFKNYNENLKKIQIIHSEIKGQVKQRISALKFIKTNNIIYMDDDLIFDNNLVNNLLKMKLQKGLKSVIAPIYFEKKNNIKIHPLSGNFLFKLKKIVHFFLFGTPINSKRMGTISLAGSCYGVDGDFVNKNPFKTKWIPGGCFIISKQYMINFDYFKRKGKAYCEDLILSHLLRKQKIELYVDTNSKVLTDGPTKIKKRSDIIDYLEGHKMFCKVANLKNFRVKIWRLIFIIRLKINNYLL